MVYCPKCGKENTDQNKFCDNCGIELTKSVNKDQQVDKQAKGLQGWWSQQNSGVKVLSIFGVCCIGLILIVGIFGMLSPDQNTSNVTNTSLDEPTTTTNTTSGVSSPTWHSVATFTGTGDKDTDTFQIKGDKFKLKVTAKTESLEYGLFSVYVYPEGETASYSGQGAIDSFDKNTETDEFFINAGSGTYYLKTIAANLDKWNIEVFDYY
jgi:hypothetical protein